MAEYYIPEFDRTVHRSKFRVAIGMLIFKRAFIANINGLKFYLFKCPRHGLQVDYSRGYKDYHACQIEGCKYQETFGGCPF